MSRPPGESHSESRQSGSFRSKSSSPERQHGRAGGESGWEDEIVVPELDAPRNCGGDPRGDLENKLADAKTVRHEVRDVRVAKVVVPLAAARRGGSGMLVARENRRHIAVRARLS
jgi:hypothetical protein